MGLLVSPIDGSPMRQVNRYGIEIDVCPTTGGVWLDKGELEKLIAFLKDETGGDFVQPRREQPYRRDDDDDDYDDRYSSGYKKKHKSKASKIMDIFDF
jgi:Zn-finger nucleic acid-binding protein